jgi:S-adenosylmethionine hydrolase
MPERRDTITFLSDYGTVDEFVGVVKSVVRSLAPHVVVVDLTHEIPPHDVRAGSLALARAMQYVAPGVVLAVVDPGVGTERRAVAVEVADGEGVLVGPDNGLLAPAVAMAGGATRAVELVADEYHLPSPGATFAGRDVFGPVSAHLCNGVDLGELGVPVDPAGLLPGIVPLSRIEDGALVTEVLWIDRFGNAQLNAGSDELPDPDADRLVLRAGTATRTVARARAYGELGVGQVGLVVDSYGLLSVCVDRASAAAELGLDVGDVVSISVPSDEEGPPASTSPVTLGRPRGGA